MLLGVAVGTTGLAAGETIDRPPPPGLVIGSAASTAPALARARGFAYTPRVFAKGKSVGQVTLELRLDAKLTLRTRARRSAGVASARKRYRRHARSFRASGSRADYRRAAASLSTYRLLATGVSRPMRISRDASGQVSVLVSYSRIPAGARKTFRVLVEARDRNEAGAVQSVLTARVGPNANPRRPLRLVTSLS